MTNTEARDIIECFAPSMLEAFMQRNDANSSWEGVTMPEALPIVDRWLLESPDTGEHLLRHARLI